MFVCLLRCRDFAGLNLRIKVSKEKLSSPDWREVCWRISEKVQCQSPHPAQCLFRFAGV